MRNALADWALSLRPGTLTAPVLDAARGRVLEALGARLAEADAFDGQVDPLTARLIEQGLALAEDGGMLLVALAAAYAVAEQGLADAMLRGLLRGNVAAALGEGSTLPAEPLRAVQDWPCRPFGGPPEAHAALEALMTLLGATALAPDHIARIEVTGVAPLPGLAESLAVAAIEGVSGLRPLRPALLAQPAVRALVARIAATAEGPPALILSARSGQLHRQALGLAWGSAARPMSRLDLQDKFCALCAPRFSSSRIDQLIQAVEGLGERAEALGELRGLLAPVSA